jgi:hypothetical protein
VASVDIPSTSGRTTAPDFALLNVTNEAINGRAAMLGFVAAVVAEAITHHSVFSQVWVSSTLPQNLICVHEDLCSWDLCPASLLFGTALLLLPILLQHPTVPVAWPAAPVLMLTTL